MWESLEFGAAVACATVLATAGVLKLYSAGPRSDAFWACLEIAIAACALVPTGRVVGLAGSLVLGLAFTANGMMRAERPCRCFGDRFKVISRRTRTARALTLVMFAAAGLFAWVASGTQTTWGRWPVSAGLLGLLLGVSAITLPSVATSRPMPTEAGDAWTSDV